MINQKAPGFKGPAYFKGEIKEISLSDYKGKWVVLFFYPADFTFVCPTELGELAAKYDLFKGLDTEIISISTDTVYVHFAWHDSSKIVGEVKFPMLADPSAKISRSYGTYIEEEGMSVRATFLIDPEGMIRAYEFHNNDIGRSSEELLRKVQAAQYVRTHNGEVCPMNWKPGAKALKPQLSMITKI